LSEITQIKRTRPKRLSKSLFGHFQSPLILFCDAKKVLDFSESYVIMSLAVNHCAMLV